jgi:hypothetical protein
MTTINASAQPSTAAQPDILGSAPSLLYDDFRAKVCERAMLKGSVLDNGASSAASYLPKNS